MSSSGAGQAQATHSWFKVEGLTLKGYTLAWSVVDNGTSGDEVSVRLSGGVNFEDSGTAGSGNVTVTPQQSMFGRTVRVTGSATIGGGGTETFTYGYDGDGNRLTKTGPSGTTRYLWDTNGPLARLAAEDRPGSGDDRVYIYGRGLVAMRTSSGTLHYSRDALGNVTETTDDTGGVVGSYRYDAWGNDTEVLTESGAPVPAPQDQPCETAYAYAKGRPTALVDPTGRRCEEPEDGGVSDTAALVGGLAAAAAFEAYLLLMSTIALPLLSVAYLTPVILLAAATTVAVIAQPAAAAEECKCQVADSAPIHHIATDKRTSKWTPLLSEIFENAGLNIRTERANLVKVPGHQGPHGDVYNQTVYERLSNAVEGLEPRTGEYANAVKDELGVLRNQLLDCGSDLHNVIVRK